MKYVKSSCCCGSIVWTIKAYVFGLVWTHYLLQENTTWDLVSDVEKLRKHLGIAKWVVFGGSWGSALSLSYAEKYPDSVKALVIGSIFTMRRFGTNYNS